MGLFQKILGVLVLTVRLHIGSFILFVWWKLRRIAKGRTASFPTPSTVNPTPEADPMCAKQDAVRSDEVLTAFEKAAILSVAKWKQYDNRMIISRDSFPAAHLDTS